MASLGSGHVMSRFSSWQWGRICLYKLSARARDIPAGSMTEGSVVEFIEVVSAVALRIVVVLSSIAVESDVRTFPSSAAEKRNF